MTLWHKTHSSLCVCCKSFHLSMKIRLAPSAPKLYSAHLCLGATRAPRWHRGGKAGHQERGNSRRSVLVCHGWTNWVWLCVNRKKKMHRWIFRVWGCKRGQHHISFSNVKDSRQKDSWLYSCHGCCSQVPLRWYMVTCVASGKDFCQRQIRSSFIDLLLFLTGAILDYFFFLYLLYTALSFSVAVNFFVNVCKAANFQQNSMNNEYVKGENELQLNWNYTITVCVWLEYHNKGTTDILTPAVLRPWSKKISQLSSHVGMNLHLLYLWVSLITCILS